MTTAELAGLVAWTVGWTVAGGLGGYVLGRLAADVHRLADPTEPHLEGDRVHDEPLYRPRPQRQRRPSGRLLIGILIVVLGVGTAVQGIITTQRVEHLQQCQARYSNKFADALDARTTVSNGSQRALDNLVTTIGAHLGRNKQADQDAIADALQQYLAQRHMAKQERARHPLPDPPREACN